MAAPPPFILPPGGKKAQGLVDAYLKCLGVEDDIYEGRSANEEDDRRKWTTSQEKRREHFNALPKGVLILIAKDEAKLEAWKDLHLKHDQAQLRRIIRDISLADKASEALELGTQPISAGLAELDPRVAPAPDLTIEKDVQLIKRMMNAMPRVAFEVLKDAQPALERTFHLACDQLRDEIAGIEKHVTKGAIEECLARALTPESWQQMTEDFRMTKAPIAALEESIELADIRVELAAVKDDLQRQRDCAEENAELRAKAEEAEHKLADAESLIQEQKSKLRDIKKLEDQLAEVRQALHSESEEKRELNRKLAASISDKQSAPEAAEKKLAAVEKALRNERNARNASREYDKSVREDLERGLDSQRQAVDSFSHYLTASLAQGSASLVVAPRAQELTILNANHIELALDQAEQLPMIVIASGHLPAAFSYLCLASGGVLTGSRFNRAVTSSNLQWVSDTLARVVKAVVASQEPVPSAVLIVLLQGIAYVHLGTRFTSVQMTPMVKDMLNSLYNLIPRHAQRVVLATVYRLVSRLVYLQSPIDSWTLDDSPLDKRIDSGNSALPEGITLIHSAGYLFLQQSATDGEHLFVVDPQAVQFLAPRMGYVYMQLPVIDGLDLRRVDMVTSWAHVDTADWLRDTGLLV